MEPLSDTTTCRSTSLDSHLPTVSVVVTNFNYGRYVGEALASVAAQTYPHVEIIVVDDVSTDDSWERIADFTNSAGPGSNVHAFRTPNNGGHGLTAAFGLKHSSGSYVIFMDADDVLLPTCVESHIYAHLSSRVPIGFTSVDVFCWVANQWVTSTYGTDRTKYICAVRERPYNSIRPIDHASECWSFSKAPALRPEEMHIVPAPACEWLWAPMSGNCFRRELVEHFLSGPQMASLRSGLDAYLMQSIASLCGSLLIDRPLIGYRIHETNSFVKSAPLSRLLVYDAKINPRPGARAGVRKTFELAEKRGNIFEEPGFFFDAVASQCRVWPELKAERGGKDFLTECLIEHENMLEHVFGRASVSEWLERSGARSGQKQASAERRKWRLFSQKRSASSTETTASTIAHASSLAR